MKLPSVPSTSEKSRLTTKKRVRSNIFTSDLDDLSTPGPSKKVKVSETLNMKKVTKKGEEESTSSSEDNEKVPYDDSETSDISEISNFKEKMELLQKKKNISQPIRTYSVSSFSSASESSHGIYQRGAGAEKKKKKISKSKTAQTRKDNKEKTQNDLLGKENNKEEKTVKAKCGKKNEKKGGKKGRQQAASSSDLVPSPIQEEEMLTLRRPRTRQRK